MIIQDKTFNNEKEKSDFVVSCDKVFDAELEKIANDIASIKGLKVLALAGPTCSGKTTTANKLIECFNKLHKDVYIISIDDFYLDRAVLNARADADPDVEIDYDSFDTIDFPAFCKCVDEIFAYKKVNIPKYDFLNGERVGYTELSPDDDDLFIFEGIQAIYPQITAVLKEHKFKSIYISVGQDIKCNDAVFDKNEIRFYRRMVRDYNFRNAMPDFTFYVWESVRENEEKNILPYAEYADIKIDSSFAYELNVIKPYLISILNLLPENSQYFEYANKIKEKFKNVEEISSDYIAEKSLYKEFIKE